jgi:DNA polymerase III sliding clamp (beta) subunit (PCNA family)
MAYKENGMLASADGYRLHVVWVGDEIADGFHKLPNSVLDEDANAKFPQFDVIFAHDESKLDSVWVYPDEMEAALQQAKVFARDIANSVVLTVNDPYGWLTIRGRSAERGDCEVQIEIEPDPLLRSFEVCYNVNYLIDAMNALNDCNKLVAMRFRGAATPLQIGNLKERICVIMPMNVPR